MDDKWLSHKFSLAAEDVLHYKKHILRAIHQDQAKTDSLAALSEERALIIFDFAMKFLPQKYREAQVDFFGKKGEHNKYCAWTKIVVPYYCLHIAQQICQTLSCRTFLACNGLSVEVRGLCTVQDHCLLTWECEAGIVIIRFAKVDAKQ